VSVAAFQEVFGSITVSGYWSHYSQAVSQRVNKLSLEEDYENRDDITDIICCIVALIN